MEYRTEFNLEKSIDQWRSTLITTANFTEDNIAELESHLLDEIQDLGVLGLSESESFLVAKKRLGRTDEISSEFNKINYRIYFLNKARPYISGALILMLYITVSESINHISALMSNLYGLQLPEVLLTSKLVLISFNLVVVIFLIVVYQKRKINLKTHKKIPLLVGVLILMKVSYYLVSIKFMNVFWIAEMGQISTLGIYSQLISISIVLMVFFSVYLLPINGSKLRVAG